MEVWKNQQKKQECAAKLCQVFPGVIYFRVNDRDLNFDVRDFCQIIKAENASNSKD